jgi:ribonucleoside-triphosphate reductase
VCPVHGYLRGEHFNCPKCKEEKEAELKQHVIELEKERELLVMA